MLKIQWFGKNLVNIFMKAELIYGNGICLSYLTLFIVDICQIMIGRRYYKTNVTRV